MAFLEKAAGQGHAYAMETLGSIYDVRKEYEQAVAWFTKAERCRLRASNPVLNAPVVTALENITLCTAFNVRFQIQPVPLN